MSNANNILAFPNSGDREDGGRAVGSNEEFLRLNRILKAKEASTPVKRAYYAAQLCLAGEMDAGEGRFILEGALVDLATRASGGEDDDLRWVAAELSEGELYPYEVMLRLVAVMDFDLDDDAPERSLLDEWDRWRKIAVEARRKKARAVNDGRQNVATGAGDDAPGV